MRRKLRENATTYDNFLKEEYFQRLSILKEYNDFKKKNEYWPLFEQFENEGIIYHISNVSRYKDSYNVQYHSITQFKQIVEYLIKNITYPKS